MVLTTERMKQNEKMENEEEKEKNTHHIHKLWIRDLKNALERPVERNNLIEEMRLRQEAGMCVKRSDLHVFFACFIKLDKHIQNE